MGSAIVGAGVPLLMGEDMSTVVAGGLGGYGAGTAFGSRFGADPNYVFTGGFEGSLGRMGENLGFGQTASSDKLLTEAQAKSLDVPIGTSVQEMVDIGKIKNPASAKDLIPFAKLTSAFAPLAVSGRDEDDGMPEWWDEDIYGPWWGASFAPAPIMRSANGGIIQKFNEGSGEEGVVDIDLDSLTWGQRQEYEDLINLRDYSPTDAYLTAKSMDLNTGGIINAYDNGGIIQKFNEGSGEEGVVLKESEALDEELTPYYDKGPFMPPRDEEGNVIPFEQPPPELFMPPRDREGNVIPFDPKEGIELLAPKKRYMINGMPTTEEVDRIFTQKFERLTDEGKMMFQMLFEKNPDAGAETILDLIMKRPEFLSGEETVGDMFEERTRNGEYTESKYADGGIAHLSAGAFPRMTGAIAGPGGPKDDMVPAMLSDGEFVMTAEAVRNAGGGDRREGARRMYQLMNQLQQGAMV